MKKTAFLSALVGVFTVAVATQTMAADMHDSKPMNHEMMKDGSMMDHKMDKTMKDGSMMDHKMDKTMKDGKMMDHKKDKMMKDGKSMEHKMEKEMKDHKM